jgi:hypothetical protein
MTTFECTGAEDACCSGICAVPITTSGAAYCAATCTTGSECVSGCCSPVVGSSELACLPRGFCAATCSAGSEPCTANTDCCKGYVCTGGACTP